MNRVALLILVPGIISAAESISGPVAGYLAGSPRPELRAIYGAPGAFRFSDPLALPDGVTRLRVAPAQDFAIVERGEAAPAAVVLSGDAVDHVTALDGVLSTADWVVFSVDARAAVFFSASAARLQVVTGLPDAPSIAMDIDAGSLPEVPVTAAVSDDGALVVAASGTSVYMLAQGGAPKLLLSGAQIQSVVVLRNGTDIGVADRGTGSLQVVRNAASSADSRTLVSGLEELGQIFPSYDGSKLFAARPGLQSISVVDLATGAVQSVDASIAPSGLVPLRNRDMFLISARPRQPAWVFYRDGDVGRVVFIPAASERGVGLKESAR